MCVSTKTDATSEPIYLSKEEVGEILVRETERRRLRASAEITGLSQLKPAVPLNTTTQSDRACLKYQDSLRQQLKTFSERCSNSWESVDVAYSGDEKPMKPALNCQLVTAQCEQQDSRTKVAAVSCNGNMVGGTSVCGSYSVVGNSNITTAACIPEAQENIQNTGEADCHNSLVSTVQPCNSRLEVDTDAASFESTPAAGAVKKKKKTVTFSDNVELVASAGDVADPVDYMSYAASIGRQANSSCMDRISATDQLPATVNGVDTPCNCSRDCDVVASENLDETDVCSSVTPTGQVRCSLCRQKWVALTDTYCSDCSFYLSKLEMSN